MGAAATLFAKIAANSAVIGKNTLSSAASRITQIAAKYPITSSVAATVLVDQVVEELLQLLTSPDPDEPGASDRYASPEVRGLAQALMTGPGSSYAMQQIHDALLESYLAICFSAFTPHAFERAKMRMAAMRYADMGPALMFKNPAVDVVFITTGASCGVIDAADLDYIPGSASQAE